MRLNRLLAAAAAVLALAVQGCAPGEPTAEAPFASEAAIFQQIPEGLRDRLGVQLYSYRHETETDFAGVLAKVHAIGFRNVETGPGRLDGPTQRAAFDAAGLRAVQVHVGQDMLRDHPEEAIAFAQAVGAEAIGLAWIKTSPDGQQFSEAETRAAAAAFNAACPAVQAAGMRLFYHVHGYEFVPYGDGTLFDLLLDLVPPECLDIQVDTFWAQHGGAPPAALIEKLGARVTSLHLKDMAKDVAVPQTSGHERDEASVALGTGQIDMAAVIAAAKAQDVRWYIIEDESPDVNEQIPVSLQWLAGLQF